MTTDIQSFAAITIVAITAGIFIFRALRVKKTGCGGGCGCPQKLKNDKT
jgi:hypothetical protein